MPVFLNSASLGFVVLVGMAFTLGYLNGEVLQDFCYDFVPWTVSPSCCVHPKIISQFVPGSR
jgi:hypothetical protein